VGAKQLMLLRMLVLCLIPFYDQTSDSRFSKTFPVTDTLVGVWDLQVLRRSHPALWRLKPADFPRSSPHRLRSVTVQAHREEKPKALP